MSNENEKTAPENPTVDSSVDSSVSDEQLEDIVGGNKSNNQKESTGQVSLNNPVADLNEDGNVTLHEVVTYNRDQRNKN
ncbi:MAG: hypothetical protein AAGN15_20430 [Cyanobacteria bacterium J06581_3]